VSIKVGVANIGIDETNTFHLNFLSSMKIVQATVLGGLWARHRFSGLRALEWAWQSIDETNTF